MKVSVLALALVAWSVQAADHIDSPAAVADPLADILDFYAFMAPACQTMGGTGCEAEPEELVLALTVSPFATGETQFSDAVEYHFFFENDVGVASQIDCSVSADQVVSCAGLNGLSVQAPVGEIGTNGDIRVFAGLRDDPFFFDFEAIMNFQTIGIAAFNPPGTDFLAGANVLSIVIGIQNAAFPAGSGATDSNGDDINVQKVWVSSERTTKMGITGGISGSWYNPDQNGQGWVIEVVSNPSGEDQFVVYFYGYDDAGGRLWLIGSGPGIDGDNASVDVIRTDGTGFGGNFDPASFALDTVGTMAFSFIDCDTATVSFSPVDGGDLAEFTTDMTRLTSISSLGCSLSSKAQIDRVGRPLISSVISAPLKDSYNAASDPSTWAASFGADLEAGLTALDSADLVAGNALAPPSVMGPLLVDDRLKVDLEWSACPGYLGLEFSELVPQPHTNDCGGRKLEEDVLDSSLSVLVSGFDPVVSDFVDANDVPFLTVFPFLAPPN